MADDQNIILDPKTLTAEIMRLRRDIMELQDIRPQPQDESYDDFSTDGPDLGYSEDSPSQATFSGRAFINGVWTTGLNADANKPYVKCNLASGAASEEAGPIPNPFPMNEEWYEKRYTYGDIHVVS